VLKPHNFISNLVMVLIDKPDSSVDRLHQTELQTRLARSEDIINPVSINSSAGTDNPLGSEAFDSD